MLSGTLYSNRDNSLAAASNSSLDEPFLGAIESVHEEGI